MKKILPLFFLYFLSANFLFSQDFAGGNGTEISPYQITSSQELQNIANYLGVENMDLHFKVMNNIDLSSENWIPIGNTTSAFHGHLDGGGFQLMGLNIGQGDNPTFRYAGLFGVIKSGAIIENVRLVGGNIKAFETNSAYIGSIAAYADARVQVSDGPNVITIENCYSSINIESNSNYALDIGGIVGRGHPFGGYMVIRMNFINCVYDGNIYSTGVTNLGGILGNSSSFDMGDVELFFINCSNRGNLTALGPATNVGGISGNMFIENTVIIQFERCYNTGTLTGGSNDSYTGGIIGYGRIFGNVNFSIQNCYHYGKLIATGDHVGGIAGDLLNGDTVIISINNCYVAGEILGSSKYAGGIVSRVANTDAAYTITNCVSALTTMEFEPSQGIGNRLVSYNLGAILSNNYSLNSMLLNGVPINSTLNNSIEGEDIIWRNLCQEASYGPSLLGWDISNDDSATWTIFEDSSLPYFQRQSAPVFVSELYRDSLVWVLKNQSDEVQVYAEDEFLFSTSQNSDGESRIEAPLSSFMIDDEIEFVNNEPLKEPSYPIWKNIEKRVIIVRADAKSKCYEDPDEELTYTIDPYLIQGDVMQGSLTRQQGEEAGEYYILQGTLDHDQYEIIYVRAVYLISHINIEISQEGETIVAEERNATYQWLDCDRQFEAIPGATQRQFAPQEEGNYAVRLEKGACIDTSESIYFKPSGINENISPTIILFPNPVYDQLNIHVGEKCNSDYVIHIYNSEGKKVEQLTMKGLLNFTIPFQHPQGLYYIHLISNHKNSVIQKVIKIAQ